MRMRKFVISKIGKEFDRDIKQIKASRKLDIDIDLPREISTERLTDAMIQLPEWATLKQKLIKEPRDLEKDILRGRKKIK